ncbi:hypothetical protein SERLA73DRAFT_162658 [Serpula lacrymans var. lacrymans S7.3]|uniref:G domain-containing protein n=2 Tax=Serpula lacrymans var. lacrymans TaxID=341189 RepID=F8Q912_SERL3|nr:uncharacterized protein SERLADRAFT_417771 [Serpula lacrymans var. lacrymans S7.9]EGN95067.1 hypothetical protein SERLA73DRAFT_162658 [Serpula lacrymans var. lacrymans S7.3]EGO20557.1 hypothetical protein SERLADRAFT_417771 [Serpula lacrymans var. lacrymans S7.9]
MTSNVRNVLFFGETGVGKSSLINMIMEGHTSGEERSCTPVATWTNTDPADAQLVPDKSKRPTGDVLKNPEHTQKSDVRNRESHDVANHSMRCGDEEKSPTSCSRRGSLHPAEVSSGAKGCTFKSKSYQMNIDGLEYKLWDTVGLNEGDLGRVPAAQAMEGLKDLVHEVVGKEGISLLVYCIRANRITQASTKNYRVFYSALCRKKVPIVIVILGLENFEGERMDSWWEQNEKDFKKYRMYFAGNACVTAIQGQPTQDGTHLYEDRYLESQRNIKKLISLRCSPQPWKVLPNHASQVIQDIVGLMQKMEEDNPNILVYNFLGPTAAIQKSGFNIATCISGEPIAETLASTVIIGGKRYTLHDADAYDRHIDISKAMEKEPRLLIFCLPEEQVEKSVLKCKEIYESRKCDIPLLVAITPADYAYPILERKNIIAQAFEKHSVSISSYTGFKPEGTESQPKYCEERLWSHDLAELIVRFTLELPAKDPGVLKSLWKNVLNVMRRNR